MTTPDNPLREIGLSLTKLRALLSDTRKDLRRIRTLQDALAAALDGFWDGSDVRRSVGSPRVWKETVALVASGRAVSVAAQADEVLAVGVEGFGEGGERKGEDAVRGRSWVGDGRAYARWLGDGVVKIAKSIRSESESGGERVEEAWKGVGELCAQSFSLGYTDDVVERVLSKLLLTRPSHASEFRSFTRHLPRYRQRHFLESTLRFLEKNVQAVSNSEQRIISGAASVLSMLVLLPETAFAECLSEWLSKTNVASPRLYRAAVAALNDEEQQNVLEKTWQQFGDKLYIRHSPIIQQEALAQVLLLTAGYVHRSSPMQVFMIARSSIHTNGTSTRLASSSPRARLLGMIVGTSISELVDKSDSRMKFDLEDTETDEAKWYQSLVYTNDEIGSVEDLIAAENATRNGNKNGTTKGPKKARKPAKAEPKPKIIEVVEDGNDSEESDDITPYAKPDSDPEDSEDDATLVERNRPKAPVYIRDLISGLQDTDNYDRHRISLVTAPSLIRRKADFGAELKDRAHELGSVLVSLHDNFEMEDLHDLRLQSMIALLTAQPQLMGPWFASTFFSGDYSIGQRASVLTTMGLGARELAGLKDAHALETKKQFPSKELPEHLHKLYADSEEVNAIARGLEQHMMQQVSTKRRKKIIRNDLAKMVAESFFFPLTGRWQGVGQMSAARSTYFSPLLLPTYLKTLAIILTSAGPSTLALPQMTSELWDLLLSVRSLAVKEVATLEAELFSFLTILNVNEDKRRLAQEHSKQLLETHEWTQMVFEKTSGADEEGERCRTLAAGVLVATKEVLDAHHRLMLGDMADFLGS